MIILDTNLISEFMNVQPNSNVVRWLSKQRSNHVFLTSITLAELRYGVAILPEGKRKIHLNEAIEGLIHEDFANRILSFDSQATKCYADIGVKRKRLGKPMSQFDCQIAAIAKSRSAILATRNIKDFEACDLTLVNPFKYPKE